MTNEPPFGDDAPELDRRIGRTLEATGADCLDPALTRATARDDRWYGRLLVDSYEATTAAPAPESVIRAAAAVELLREYWNLRSDLLVETGDEGELSSSTDPTSVLLSGDYLYTSAYSALGDADHFRLSECFETLSTVATTIIESFARADASKTQPSADFPAFVDGTAGVLGRGAAVIGATLADATGPRIERFATVGLGLGTARRIRLVLDSGCEPASVATSELDAERIRAYAADRLADADRALRDLSSTVDVEPLRRHYESVSELDQ